LIALISATTTISLVSSTRAASRRPFSFAVRIARVRDIDETVRRVVDCRRGFLAILRGPEDTSSQLHERGHLIAPKVRPRTSWRCVS